MDCWVRRELEATASPGRGDEKKKSPTPEVEPGKPIPQELPPAESPVPEVEPYQTPPPVTPDLPQPTA
jgi:hypothetical protein